MEIRVRLCQLLFVEIILIMDLSGQVLYLTLGSLSGVDLICSMEIQILLTVMDVLLEL